MLPLYSDCKMLLMLLIPVTRSVLVFLRATSITGTISSVNSAKRRARSHSLFLNDRLAEPTSGQTEPGRSTVSTDGTFHVNPHARTSSASIHDVTKRPTEIYVASCRSCPSAFRAPSRDCNCKKYVPSCRFFLYLNFDTEHVLMLRFFTASRCF